MNERIRKLQRCLRYHHPVCLLSTIVVASQRVRYPARIQCLTWRLVLIWEWTLLVSDSFPDEPNGALISKMNAAARCMIAPEMSLETCEQIEVTVSTFADLVDSAYAKPFFVEIYKTDLIHLMGQALFAQPLIPVEQRAGFDNTSDAPANRKRKPVMLHAASKRRLTFDKEDEEEDDNEP